MQFAGINHLAILVAAVVAWLGGAAYYTALGKRWVAAQGKTVEQFHAEQAAKKGTPAAWLPFALAFLADLAMAWVLAGMVGHLGAVTIRSAVIWSCSCGPGSPSAPCWSTTPSRDGDTCSR